MKLSGTQQDPQFLFHVECLYYCPDCGLRMAHKDDGLCYDCITVDSTMTYREYIELKFKEYIKKNKLQYAVGKTYAS